MANQRIASSVTDLAPQHISAISNGERAGEYAQPNYSSASDAVIVDFGQTMSCLYPNAGSFAFNAMLQMPEIDEVAFMECEDHTLTDPVQLALTDPECACEQSTYWARMYGANCKQENVKYCCSAAETPCGALAKSRGYHPDYLGSIEAVTDARGEVYQFFHNTIWGEPLQDQRSVLYNSFTSPYRFNGKERDWESGNFYYGARYYDPKVSVWLGVDPLAGEAPYLTPYRFSFNDPLNVIDPNGMFETGYDLDKETGQLTVAEGENGDLGGDDYDVIIAEDGTQKRVDKGVIDPDELNRTVSTPNNTDCNGEPVNSIQMTTLNTTKMGRKRSKKLFEFIADHADVEFSYTEFMRYGTSDLKLFISTSHESQCYNVYNCSYSFSESSAGIIINRMNSNGYSVLRQFHSHPQFQGVQPSNLRNTLTPSRADRVSAGSVIRTNNRLGRIKPKFYMYSPLHRAYQRYGPGGRIGRPITL